MNAPSSGKIKDSLEKHLCQSCDCFQKEVAAKEKRCVYREFLDGWSFVPDVGEAQSRGEIFTPRWVVDQMIVDSGMLPEAAVYREDYSAAKPVYIEARVSEPAVGTANYLATILYHKLRYAESLSKNRKGKLGNLDRYHTNFLVAVASVYAYDIDAGNLATTKRRLLSFGKQKLNIPQTVDWWTSEVVRDLNRDPEKRQKVGYSRVRPSVRASLDAAQRHWYKFVGQGQGIIDSAYRRATGERMPGWLYDQCREILDKNIKLFDGIKEGDTLDWENNFFVPGWGNVVWTWWHFQTPHRKGWQPMVAEKEVPLREMLSDNS